MNDKTSIIRKILNKGIILTPFEAIQLKYLSEKGLLEELINIERSKNPYIVIQEGQSSMSPYYVNYIIGRTREDNPDVFSSYNFAYNALFEEDKQGERLGYKGLMLLSHLRMIRAEYGFSITYGKPATDLFGYQIYSYYHQGNVTFTDVLASLGETFSLFIKNIDNILTLNYFLERIVDINDLLSLRLLKMWLNKPENSEDYGDVDHLNGAYLCCTKENIENLLNDNHPDFIEGIRLRIRDLPSTFSESSLSYVKDVIFEIIGQHRPPEDRKNDLLGKARIISLP